MSKKNGRQECVLYASCIGHGIKYFMQLSEDFNRQYLVRSHIFHDMSLINAMLPKLEPELEHCAVFVYHEPEALPQQVYEETFVRLEERVARQAARIALPLPYFHALWPFQGNDPRNSSHDRPLNRYGTLPHYHYGDNYIVGLLKKGIPSEEVIARYLDLDVSREVDLDALLRGTLSMIERSDRNQPVRIADFVASQFQSGKLFQSFNHPSNRLLLYIANQILKALNCQQVPERVLSMLTEMIEEPMPIHPNVARYYGLKFADESTRYPMDEIRYLTFAEFVWDYVYYKDGLIL